MLVLFLIGYAVFWLLFINACNDVRTDKDSSAGELKVAAWF